MVDTRDGGHITDRQSYVGAADGGGAGRGREE
jgi:hypothetical protein